MIAAHCPAAVDLLTSVTTRLTTTAPPMGTSASEYSGFQVTTLKRTSYLLEGLGGLFELVIAPEELLADRQRRHALDAQLDRAVGGLAQGVLDRAALHALRHRARVQLASGRRDQHVVDLGQRSPGVEELPERRQRK